MNEEENVKIFHLVVKSGNLPSTLDKLVPLSFIGAAAVKFYQAKVKLMDQLGMTEAQRKATLGDGQDAGEMLLNIEARIGELYEAIPSQENPPGVRSAKGALRGGRKAEIKEAGLEPRRAQAASSIHRNPVAVAAVIKEARENEDIPTKTAVLKEIQLQKVREAQKDKIPDTERIRGMLGEDEFHEWAQWAKARMIVKKRIALSQMTSAAQREIRRVAEGIRSDIENYFTGEGGVAWVGNKRLIEKK
jgi:hypothetical protein